jgi:hypothetical protein
MRKPSPDPLKIECSALGGKATANPTGRSDERTATAAYVAELSLSLAALARGQRLDTLCYLLDLARLEAETISGKAAKPSDPTAPSRSSRPPIRS